MEILWHRLDIPGEDKASLTSLDGKWMIQGVARFKLADSWCDITYRVVCDGKWRVQSALVSGTIKEKRFSHEMVHWGNGDWKLDGINVPFCAGCVDFDLEFSPSTNLIPIRRLRLKAGQEACTRAAWLRFPSLKLEPLEQVYRRTGTSIYRYETNFFTTDLTVNLDGFVVDYPGFWHAEFYSP